MPMLAEWTSEILSLFAAIAFVVDIALTER